MAKWAKMTLEDLKKPSKWSVFGSKRAHNRPKSVENRDWKPALRGKPGSSTPSELLSISLKILSRQRISPIKPWLPMFRCQSSKPTEDDPPGPTRRMSPGLAPDCPARFAADSMPGLSILSRMIRVTRRSPTDHQQGRVTDVPSDPIRGPPCEPIRGGSASKPISPSRLM